MAWAELELARSGEVAHRCEVQTALAEWVEVGPRRWERRLRQWQNGAKERTRSV